MVNPGPLSSNGVDEWKRMEAPPRVARIKNFIADATAFILEKARKAMAERNEFRIALSWDRRIGRDDASSRCKLCSQVKRMALDVHISAHQSCAPHFVSRRGVEKSPANRACARGRPAVSRRASQSFRRRSDMDDWGVTT